MMIVPGYRKVLRAKTLDVIEGGKNLWMGQILIFVKNRMHQYQQKQCNGGPCKISISFVTLFHFCPLNENAPFPVCFKTKSEKTIQKLCRAKIFTKDLILLFMSHLWDWYRFFLFSQNLPTPNEKINGLYGVIANEVERSNPIEKCIRLPRRCAPRNDATPDSLRSHQF